jgi:hypothetical protein
MTVSQETRDSVAAQLSDREAKQNLYRGKLEGVRAVAAENVRADVAIKRVANGTVRYLGGRGETARGAVRKSVRSTDRGYFAEALERLIAAGQVEIVSGLPGDLLRLVNP